MFHFARQRVVTWPATINVPQDGGAVEPVTIDVHLALLTQTELENLLRDFRSADPLDLAAREAAVLRDKVRGWALVVDEASGEPIAFGPQALDALIDVPYVRAGWVAALLAASRGAPAKN